MKTEHLKITGMTSGGCVTKVTRALKEICGVGDLLVSLPNNEAAVEYDETQTSPEKLKSAVVDAGYGIAMTNRSHPQLSSSDC